MKSTYERYFSWNDFLDYVDWQKPNSQERSHDTDEEEWFGTPNFGAAMRLARYGWTKFMHRIKTTDTDCWDMLNNLQLWETKHSVVGSGVDVGRYVIGMPDCMSYQDSYLNDKFHAAPKFVNVVVNVSYSCGRDWDYVLKRGLDVVSAINTLETNNVKTRIILLENVREYDYLYRIFIKIKDYQDIFYLEKLMFPIAHTSFLRRLIFSAEEREPREIRDLFEFNRGGGYAEPTNRFEYDDKNTLYFGTEPLGDDDIKEWIQAVIEGNSEDYDGNSELDKHLEKLQRKAGQKESLEELKKYMQEKNARYEKIQQQREQDERAAKKYAKELAKKVAAEKEKKDAEDMAEKSAEMEKIKAQQQSQQIQNGGGSAESESTGATQSQQIQDQQKSDNGNGGSGQIKQQGQGQQSQDQQQGESQTQKDQQKSDGGNGGSDQSKQQGQGQQQSQHAGNNKRMLPAIRQPSLPVLRTHYYPQIKGTLVPVSSMPHGSILPVPLAFYQQNQIVR